MTPDEHEAVQELLAGHVLHALDEDDARLAEELLTSHVPSCPACLTELDRLTSVAGELALAAGSLRPPHLLGVRLRRETSARRVALWIGRGAAAAAVVVLGGVLLWNLRLNGRVSHAEARQARTAEVLTTVAHPLSKVVPLSAETTAAQEGSVSATFVPGRRALYLFGSLPEPGHGNVYQVWLFQRNRFWSAAVFVPEAGAVLLKLDVDPTTYDRVLITEEPGSGSRAPSGRHVVTAAF